MFKQISNVSRTLIINTFEGFYYEDSLNTKNAIEMILKSYSTNRLLTITREIAKSIKVQILNESTHSFKPFGDSASLLVGADLKDYNNGVLHLKESHITFHTYIEDALENFLIIRLELHICSCTEENVFLALPKIFHHQLDFFGENKFLYPQLIIIDYLKRGSAFTSNNGEALNKNCHLANKIADKAFGSNYNSSKQFQDSNTQRYLLTMNENLIKNCLYNQSKKISEASILKFIEFLKKGYAEPFSLK